MSLLSEIISYRKKYEEIIDQRLGLGVPQAPMQAPQVVPRRQDWNKVRSRYESMKREEMWRARIEAVEKADAEKENVSTD